MDVHSTDWDDVEAAAEALANNHARFDSFCWHDPPEDAHDWCVVYTHNRDSDLLAESNADAVRAELEGFDEDVTGQRHTHWAVGWVDGLVVRVYRNGEITPAFRKLCEVMARLADYPCLDEEDHSEREYEATLDNIKDAGRRLLNGSEPDDWASQVFGYFWDFDQAEVGPRDGGGGYPSERGMKEALLYHGWLDEGEVYRVERDGEVALRTLDEGEAYGLAEHLYWKSLGESEVVLRLGGDVIHREGH